MATGDCLPGPDKVRRLQNVLHAKAKGEPEARFYTLIDKVWRMDFLAEAWRRVRRNGGSAGVDGETFADIEEYGVGRWLGELARDLEGGRYKPRAVRRMLIQAGSPLFCVGKSVSRDKLARLISCGLATSSRSAYPLTSVARQPSAWPCRRNSVVSVTLLGAPCRRGLSEMPAFARRGGRAPCVR